ncbi:MAG: Gfo/Idh/MocA family oxidoreductase [Defluviitaleaceae bacterium]|nr:Gfo/Idh/MocA family oxidoreductase [Defluviitaleaceae bacterium]
MEKIRLGIIGLGLAWQRLHAPALARLTDKFEIVAVCDRDEEKVSNVARFLGLSDDSAFTDYKEMLTRKDIEAIETLVPISENFETAAAVIKSGKHLIAEKPFAATLEAAHQLIKLRDRHKVTVMVAENERYEEQNTIIKNLIDNGQIGTPIYFIDNHVVNYKEESEHGGFGQTEWRQNPDYQGGVIMDSGVHHTARMRFLFGEVQRAFANGYSTQLDFTPFSCVNSLLSFGENISGHYSFFITGKETQAPLVGLRIFGTQGEIFLEEPDCGFVNISFKDERSSVAIAYTPAQGYFHELENFHAALRNNVKIESTPEKALGDMETIFAILESIRSGMPVNPKEAENLAKAIVLPRVTAYPGARSRKSKVVAE